MTAIRPALVAILLAVLAADAAAQDSQPWYQAYGNRGRLLGGLTIGGDGDVSAVFYNPGQIAFGETSELLLSANTYELRTIDYVNRERLANEIRASSFDAVPTLIAGDFGGRGERPWRFAYSILSRQRFEAEVRHRGRLETDSLGAIGELPYAAFDLELRPELSEQWFGVTVSHRLRPTLALGVTASVAVRNQQSSAELVAQGLADDTTGVLAIRKFDYDYEHWGVLAKFGLLWQNERSGAGLTVTTPRARLWGSGTVGLLNGYVDEGVLSDGRRFASTVQEDIPSRFDSPWSVGAGVHHALGRTSLHAAAEWYDAVAAAPVLDAEPIATEVYAEPIDVDVVHSGKSIVNLGVAGDYRLGATTTVYLAWRTDLTTVSDDDVTNTSHTRWDLQHLSAGASFGVGRSNFALGVDYAFGTKDSIRLVPRGVPEIGVEIPVDATVSALSFLLGYKLEL